MAFTLFTREHERGDRYSLFFGLYSPKKDVIFAAMRSAAILLGTLSLALTLAGHAAGQLPSLASKPAGEKFTSEQCGFTIAMPAKPSGTKTEETLIMRGMTFSWDFQEGGVMVQCGEFTTGGAKATEKDGAAFVTGFAEGFLKELQPASSLIDAPYKLGDYSGKSYSMVYQGQKIQMNVAVYGNKYFSVTAFAFKEVPGSEALVFNAAKTFSLIAPVRNNGP
jgi:hypothetical protein